MRKSKKYSKIQSKLNKKIKYLFNTKSLYFLKEKWWLIAIISIFAIALFVIMLFVVINGNYDGAISDVIQLAGCLLTYIGTMYLSLVLYFNDWKEKRKKYQSPNVLMESLSRKIYTSMNYEIADKEDIYLYALTKNLRSSNNMNTFLGCDVKFENFSKKTIISFGLYHAYLKENNILNKLECYGYTRHDFIEPRESVRLFIGLNEIISLPMNKNYEVYMVFEAIDQDYNKYYIFYERGFFKDNNSFSFGLVASAFVNEETYTYLCKKISVEEVETNITKLQYFKNRTHKTIFNSDLLCDD